MGPSHEETKEMLRRKRLGWEYMAAERRSALAELVTKDAMPAFDGAFTYAKSLPARTESGLVEFYRILARQKS